MSAVIADLEKCGGSTSLAPHPVVSADLGLADFLNSVSEAAPTVAHKSTLLRPSRRRRSPLQNKKAALIGGGLLAALIVLAGLVVSLRTKDGTLIVRVTEPDADVQVLNEEGKVEITRKGDTQPISISVDPGKHRLKVEKAGFKFFTQDFSMESGGEHSITATLMPMEEKPKVAEKRRDSPPDSKPLSPPQSEHLKSPPIDALQGSRVSVGVDGVNGKPQQGDGESQNLADSPTRLDYEQYALTHAGDASRGRQLFQDEKLTKCALCHRVQGKGGEAAPDLSQIGGKFDRAHLIESLLEPSRQIVEGFRTSIVVTTDGRTLTGIVREQSPERIVLFDATGARHAVATSEIAQRETSPVSLMPQRLETLLSREQFTDLIAYLETLGANANSPFGGAISGPIKLPDGFQVQTICTGLTGCTALETTADGRIFVCEQTGALRVVKGGKLLKEPFVTLPVDSSFERGLIGVTVDPDFPRAPFIYVCYVAKDPYPHHRVSRFTAKGDVAAPDSEQLLLEGDDQRNLGGNVPAGHQGGALHFGVDGKLYVSLGEQTAETPAQQLTTLQGKILRINRDGTIPGDNPFLGETSGKYRAIWCRGLRNPFTFAVRPSTGELFINDVGGKFEEINLGLRGANYGWPVADHGPTSDARFRGPIHVYPQASIAGGAFVPADGTWPAEYRGRYFFADFVHGWIHSLDPDHPEDVQTFASGLRRPVDLRFTADGRLVIVLRNAWVIDDKFQPGTSTVAVVSRAATGKAVTSGKMPPRDATEFQGHSYKFFPEVLTWHQAKVRCEELGGHLPIVTSTAEQTFIADLAKKGVSQVANEGLWLGATDEQKEGDWRWIDGTVMDFNVWGPGQPNNKENAEHYVLLWLPTSEWSDQPDKSQQHTAYFVCEWDQP
jgi:putative heme-binding domain-containing protein